MLNLDKDFREYYNPRRVLCPYFSDDFMNIIASIISTVVSTGIIAGIMHYFYSKRLKTHEMRVERYTCLIDELSKLMANEADWEKLRFHLNGALCFGSDEVVAAIIDFNEKFTLARTKETDGVFQLSAADITPVIIAIRKDINLKSKSIKTKNLCFFQKPS